MPFDQLSGTGPDKPQDPQDVPKPSESRFRSHSVSDKDSNASDKTSDSRPDSPKDYKNLSINSILNVRGVNALHAMGASAYGAYGSSLLPPLATTSSISGKESNGISSVSTTPTSPRYVSNSSLNSNSLNTTTSSLTNPTSSSHNSTNRAHHSETSPYAYSEKPYSTTGVPSQESHLHHRASYPSNSLTSTSLGYPGVAHPYQPSLAQNHQLHLDYQTQPQHQSLQNQPLQNQHQPQPQHPHSAQDLDPLHESKRGRRFRRRYNQIVRRYSCSYPGCNKSYGSLNHLNTHIVTKKHGHRKSKADFQHQQLAPSEGDLTPFGAYAGQAPPHTDYASGNYWYGYRPQGGAGGAGHQNPLAGSIATHQNPLGGGVSHQNPHHQLSAPHQNLPGTIQNIHHASGLPPPVPNQVGAPVAPGPPGPGYFYYPPGYQQNAPPPPQHTPAWLQQPVYSVYQPPQHQHQFSLGTAPQGGPQHPDQSSESSGPGSK